MGSGNESEKSNIFGFHFISWHFILKMHKRKSYCKLDRIFDLCIELSKERSNQCTRCLIYEHGIFYFVGEMCGICSVIVTPFAFRVILHFEGCTLLQFGTQFDIRDTCILLLM